MVVAVVGVGPAHADPEEPLEEQREGEQDSQQVGVYRLDAILIEGLIRTRRKVVERELLFEEGDVATLEEIEESVQRLRNTGIFRQVSFELEDRSVGAYEPEQGGEAETEQEPEVEGRLLRLRLDERWTLSAFFQFGQGGDTFSLLVGAMDTNLRGRYRWMEVVYSRVGDANSFWLLYRNPRFMDQRQNLEFRVARNNRLVTLYDRDGRIDGGYLRSRRQVNTGIDREWWRGFATGLSLSMMDDSFGLGEISESRRDGQIARGGAPPASQTVRVGVSGRFGQIDRLDYRSRGTILGLSVYQDFHFGEPERFSQRAAASIRQFTELPRDSTLGIRGTVGFTTSEQDHHHTAYGGLDAIRGTLDMRHRGQYHWLGNIELRVPTLKTPWLVVQQTAFVDAVGVTPYPSHLFEVSAVTTGLGIRIISRDFDGLILRIDYALPTPGADGPRLSFGAGQFF